jgi:hypothetical protein
LFTHAHISNPRKHVSCYLKKNNNNLWWIFNIKKNDNWGRGEVIWQKKIRVKT